MAAFKTKASRGWSNKVHQAVRLTLQLQEKHSGSQMNKWQLRCVPHWYIGYIVLGKTREPQSHCEGSSFWNPRMTSIIGYGTTKQMWDSFEYEQAQHLLDNTFVRACMLLWRVQNHEPTWNLKQPLTHDGFPSCHCPSIRPGCLGNHHM